MVKRVGIAVALAIGIVGCETIPETPVEATVCDDTANPDCAPDSEIEVIDE